MLSQAAVSSSISHTLPKIGGTILNSGTSSKTATYTSGLSIGTVKMNSSTSTYYVPYASSSQTGVVNTESQTFAGAKTFSGAVTLSSTLSVTGTSTFTGAAIFNNGLTGTLTGNVTGNLTGTASYANALNQNATMTYGWNGLNYFNINGTAGNAAKANDTPTTAWWHIIRLNHANGTGYYTDLAIPFNANSLYYKRICGGVVQDGGWVKVLDALNYSSSITSLTNGLTVSNGTLTPLTIKGGV